MSSVELSKRTEVKPVDMKLEVVLLGVSEVDRAKAFYENLGWRLDIDIAGGDFRGVQMTPHNSGASIIFGKGSDPTHSLILAVDDIAARDDLVARGVAVSEVFHYADGPLNNTVENPRVERARPGRSFLLLVCVVRGSGREWLAAPGSRRGFLAASGSRRGSSKGRRDPRRAPPRDGTAPRQLREDARRHNWWDWYAPYLSASERQQSGGSSRRRRSLHGAAPLKTKEDLWPQQK